MYIPTLMSNSWQEIAVKLHSHDIPLSSSFRLQNKLRLFLKKNEMKQFFKKNFGKKSLATIEHRVEPIGVSGLEHE